MERQCSTCRHWSKGAFADQGQCRRFPPSPHIQPFTRAFDLCGEWAPADREAAHAAFLENKVVSIDEYRQ